MKEFKKQIKAAKLEKIDEELEAFGKDPWGGAYKFIRKKGKTGYKEIETGEENKTRESIEKERIEEYFPKENDNAKTTEERPEYSEEGKRFTRREIRESRDSMKRKRATKEDRIPSECLKALEEEKRKEMLEILEECRRNRIFPKIWKEQNWYGYRKRKGV